MKGEGSQDRVLYDSENSLLLVDDNGDPYEPYALAWRYLGMYFDCYNDNQEGCSRVVLWAAYIDKRYKGGSIGEYQYYNISNNSWDKSTCKTRRCAKMDCHEPNTHFTLLGVFKELDGMEDWAEQLFKHHGYCVWDEDGYEVGNDVAHHHLNLTYFFNILFKVYVGLSTKLADFMHTDIFLRPQCW